MENKNLNEITYLNESTYPNEITYDKQMLLSDLMDQESNLFVEEQENINEAAGCFSSLSTVGCAGSCASSAGTVACWG